MNNAITMSTYHQWRKCSSVRDLASLLVREVRLEGKRIEEQGRCTLARALLSPQQTDTTRRWIDVTWFRIGEGLLLVRWSYIPEYYSLDMDHPLILWIPDAKSDNSPLVKACMRNIAAATITPVAKRRVSLSIKQEVGFTVESVLLLQDDYSLYAFPLDEVPHDHLLQDLDSNRLSALAFKFVETGYTGYFDLRNCTLFIQGPAWRFSRFPWLKREPALAIQKYAYMVLVAGKDRSIVACDGSEKRECLFCEQFAGEVISVIHRLIFRAAITGDMPEDPYFNPRGEWEEAMKDWQVLLAHDDWEHLFETLCKPDYQKHTLDTTWLSLINRSYRADYSMMKEVLRYLYDWVEQVLETEEGITAYCIW